MAGELCRPLRDLPPLPAGLRPRLIDATTVQGPSNVGTEWRLHYTIDLLSLACDWHELTDQHVAESLSLPPVQPGDVLIGDRGYLFVDGIGAVVQARGHVLVRLRWTHPRMLSPKGRKVSALALARSLRIGEVGDFPVELATEEGALIRGRVVSVKLPRPVAEAARQRLERIAAKKQRKPHPKSLEAAGYVMLFTTLPSSLLNAQQVADLYRHRWQIELAFKRMKQLLRLGQLPHKDPQAARSWILAKLVVALLLENLYRTSLAISPWGYRIAFVPHPA
jgi:hypothetical protein